MLRCAQHLGAASEMLRCAQHDMADFDWEYSSERHHTMGHLTLALLEHPAYTCSIIL
jgi:hypothetical protein